MPSTATSILDGLSTSVAVKAPVKAVSSGNLTLSGEQTVGSVACVSGDRVLAKNQDTTTENGIYVVSSGSWTRAKDFDGNRDVRKGTLVPYEGSTNVLYRVTSANPIIIDTSAITFESAIANLTRTDIGDVLNPQTDAEGAALVTPTNAEYAEGVLERYGLAGDGTTDDSTAFANAALVAAQGVRLLGSPGKTYAIASAITCGTVFDLDLRGASIRPSGNSGRLTSDAPSAAATSTVSSGASQGSREVVVASAASMAVGHRAKISASNFPAFWATITSINSTTLEFDRVVPVTYAGTINIATYASLKERLRIVNGVFDGDNVTGSAGNSGQAIRALGFEDVDVTGLTFKNYAPASGGNRPLHVENCVRVKGSFVAFDNDIPGSDNIAHFTSCQKVLVSGAQVDGGHFGFNIELSETAIAVNNALNGRYKLEIDESVSPEHSIRGIKVEGCAYALIQGNDISDYESPIKVEQIHRFIVSGNTIRNAGLATYSGQVAISITSASAPEEPYGIINGNLVENCGGVAIGIDSGGGVADANVNVNNNIVRGCGRYAIYSEQSKLTCIGNQIENWNSDSGGTGDTSAAIYNGSGLVAIGNTFTNSDATDACFRNNFVGGEEYFYRGNIRTTGNPYFTGSKVIESDRVTATILNGTTSIAVNHNLVRTPIASEIYLDHTSNPTNDPGILWVSVISATQITVNCRADPGASMNVAVRVLPEMPFTA